MLEEINYKTVLQYMSISDQLQLWGHILNRYVSIGQVFTNPMRADKHPGCFLRQHGNILLLTDYSAPEYNKYTILHAINHYVCKGLNNAALLAYTALYFNKPLQLNNVPVSVGQTQKGRRSSTKIFFNSYLYNGVPCFTKKSFEYWSRAGVKLQDLVEADIFDVSSYYINDKLVVPKIKPVFAYFRASTGNVKLYSPYESKENKFLGTTSVRDWWIVNEGNTNLLITKSVKDMLTFKNILPNWTVVAFNSESIICKEFDITNYLNIKICYDFDNGGIKGAETLQKHYNKGDIIYFDSTWKDAFGIATNESVEFLKETINKMI